MEKLKEDCIITDERLEYMKAIAELYVPNLEAEIYKNICTTTALPIFIKRYNQNKLKEYGKFTYEKYVANKEIKDTLKGLRIDIDKFWFLLLFIFDYTCGTCIDGMKGYGAGIEQLKEAVKAIVENHERTTPYGITFKSPIKITVEIGDKDKRTIVIDSPDAIAHTAASIINSINEIEDHPWMQNQRMTFIPTEEKQTIHIWMFYKMFQDFFNLPPYKKQFNRRRKKGEQGLSLSKIFLVSKLIYFTRLSTNTKFDESDENLRGYISLHKGRIINSVNSIY